MKITGVTSEIFEWERPGIWNGGHFYGPGRLHKVTRQHRRGDYWLRLERRNRGGAAVGVVPALCRLFQAAAHRA